MVVGRLDLSCNEYYRNYMSIFVKEMLNMLMPEWLINIVWTK